MDIPSYLYRDNENLQRYFALLVQILQDGVGNNGFQITTLTTSQRDRVIDKDFEPILPVGTTFYITDLVPTPAPQVIVTSAVKGVSNAVLKTYVLA